MRRNVRRSAKLRPTRTTCWASTSLGTRRTWIVGLPKLQPPTWRQKACAFPNKSRGFGGSHRTSCSKNSAISLWSLDSRITEIIAMTFRPRRCVTRVACLWCAWPKLSRRPSDRTVVRRACYREAIDNERPTQDFSRNCATR